MNKNQFNEEELSFKKVFESFRYWPKIFRLVYSINKRYLILVLFLNILMGLMPTASLIITQKLINNITFAIGKSSKERETVLVFFVLLIGVGIATNVIGIIKRYYEEMFQKILNYDVNIRIMDKARRLQLRDFDNSETYDKLQRAQKEAGFRPFQVLMSILTIISGVVTLISAAMILIVWKWWVACLLIIVPVFSTVSLLKQGQREFLVQWKRAPKSRKAWYLSYLLTRDTTFKEIKLYGLGGHIIEKYTEIYNGFLKIDRGLVRKRSLLTFIFDMVNQLVIAIVTGTIIIATIAGEIFVGDLVGYIKAVALTQSNSMLILNTIFKMYQNNLFIKQLFEFLELKEDEHESQKGLKGIKEIKSIEKIEFKNVWFKYENADTYALENVSFKLYKNESAAVVGENGSGKTTLVKLLTGLYEITEGDILINDISIKKLDKKTFRNHIGITLQDFIKYELTARENIGFGNLDKLNDDRSVMESAHNANIDDFIEKLPNGLEHQLGVWFENGLELSGGQWQKIAISRAFIRNASLYVLDEPSAALDPISEREIFHKFYKLTNSKIGIFISHRFSTVKKASKILVFNKGRIIERGTHEELMDMHGYYAELYNVQAEPFKS